MIIDTMDCAQRCDWLARKDGWGFPGDQGILIDGTMVTLTKYWRRVQIGMLQGQVHTKKQADHPYPPTLDGAAAAERAMWLRVERVYCDVLDQWEWRVWQPNPYANEKPWVRLMHAGVPITAPDTGDEISDRFGLAVMCRMEETQ